MSYSRLAKNKLIIFLSTCFIVLAFTYIGTVFSLPNQITLFENKEYTYDFKSPFFVNIKPDTEDILIFESKDTKVNNGYYRLSDPIMFKPQKMGRVHLNMRLFGFIPLKTMQVDVVPNREVIACGNTIGVKINVEGLLVLALSDFDTLDGKSVLPAKEAGIKPGDLIVEVNRKPVDSISGLIEYLDKSNGKNIHVKYKRGNSYHNTKISPAMSLENRKYQLGMWLRDSTAGIGTLTFYDPETGGFGALGHGITDIDTGILMPLDEGEIVESSILAVKKGRQGEPGELKGILIEDRDELGRINKNCEQGIYGTLNKNIYNDFSNKLYSIGLKNEIKTGSASIMSNIDGKSVEKYDIEIQKISGRNTSGSKGMIIKVTDNRLLETTGGIVQGMSGSPILQNGKLVGAVTHVLINDPTKGYGIFIESMIKNMDSLNTNLKKAS
ncbi:SpoIVB peptidase [Herbivorax sp. ANBcel31]|uniref:SpoIVB peptidase n=1 Tax=Herbivorax sp. ANBcel31 TaxID=3069754 RepID=UPI0027B03641|nr:SpoIVB peptidase [Herbivorax sp. ANBcel31]MDQ2086635.1 SpoIVB peptidase [Herbivorax sp. ANBcel31]